MADVTLNENQNVEVRISLENSSNVAVAGLIDAGTLSVTFTDPAPFTVTDGADTSSFNVKANGTLTSANVATVSGSFNGVPLTPGTLTFDVVVAPPTQITLTPGTPANN